LNWRERTCGEADSDSLELFSNATLLIYISKGQAFYRHILNDLDIPASDALMAGGSFKKDVQAANTVGIFAVWFNPNSDETRESDLHSTIHSMQELRMFFASIE